MILEGPLMEPGEYQGIDGNKIAYSKEVLDEGAATGEGKPVIYRHTKEDGEEERLVVGYSAALNNDEGVLSHRLAIYNPDVFPFVEDGTFNAVSPEVDIDGTYDEATGIVTADKMAFTSYALTNHARKGIPTASIDGHKMIHISLERRKTDMDTKEKHEAAFNGIPEDVRLDLARKFLEDKGKTITDKPIEEPKTEPEASPGIANPDVVDKKVVDQLVEKAKAQAAELAYFQDKELATITDGIKKVDPEFDSTAMLEGAETFLTKKARLESYQVMLNRVIPRVKLELAGNAPGQIDADKKLKIEAALEMYGSAETAREYVPELFPKEGTK